MNKKPDPNRIVTTAFGKKAVRNECRAIKGAFYKMNEECFKFNGRWYRINSGFIVKDISTGKWILKEGSDIVMGLAYIDNKVQAGYFTKDPFKNIPVKARALPEKLIKDLQFAGTTVYAYNEDVVKALNLVEDIPTGVYDLKTYASKKIEIGGSYNFKVDYSFENTGGFIKEAFREYSKTIPLKVSSKKADLLNNFSFGWEFETTDGYIHPRYLMKTGLIPLRDGSISGYEFVTCPMSGKLGLQTTIDAAKLLKRYTTNNISCSLHLHIGGMPVNETFLTDFYKVAYAIQGDIFSIFPKAMSNTSLYKQQDYCNPLPGFSPVNIKKVIDWVSNRNGYYEQSYRGLGKRNHPDDEGNNRKWAVRQRYCWVNIVPYVFTTRHTVEFRIHPPSSNPAKLINWLYICAGIVTFAQKYAPNYSDVDIKKLSLKTLLRVVYSKDTDVVTHLEKYIDWRKVFMRQCTNAGDEIGSTEIMNDTEFTFPFEGRATLVGNG